MVLEYLDLLIGMILNYYLGVNGLVNIPAPWILWVRLLHDINLDSSLKYELDMDVGQNGRPRGPQMEMSSLVLTIQLLGYLILTHTHMKLDDLDSSLNYEIWCFLLVDCIIVHYSALVIKHDLLGASPV